MPKKGVSSLELAALIQEMQILVKGKVSQIYQQDKKEMLLQLHAVGKGKQLLKVIPGKLLCFTHEKHPPTRPTGFCMQLRKYLANASIKQIYQQQAERIVVFELEKKETYYIIIELFSKGNIIFTDSKWNIIGNLENQTWKDRVIKPKIKYEFPSPGVNWKEITEKKLSEILKSSEKKNLATSLATELNLGGLYAEEVCALAEVDKRILPSELKPAEVKKILQQIKSIITKIKTPKGFIYENEITPFELSSISKQEIKQTTDTYSESINTINPFEKASPYDKKIAALQKTIAQQQEAIEKQEKNIGKNTQKGEKIYEHYAPLQKLLDAVSELKQSNTWQEISKSLKKEKKIKSVNLKEKKVVIELK